MLIEWALRVLGWDNGSPRKECAKTMNDAVMQAVAIALMARPEILGDVLDVGAFDVNGNLRGLFPIGERFPSYIGVDMREGPNVDHVAKADAMPFTDGQFGFVISAEMLEHDDRFWLSLREFFRVLKPGGHLIVTTRGIGYPRHDHPSDYWRFTDEGLRAAMEWAGFEVLGCSDPGIDREGLLGAFGIARKPEARSQKPEDGPNPEPRTPNPEEKK